MTAAPKRSPPAPGVGGRGGTDMNGGKNVTAVQGSDTPAGGVPTLNIERTYRTTVPADELARALAGHFRAQEFETGLPRQQGPHGDAGAQGKPVAHPARGRLRADRGLHPREGPAEHRP